MILSDSLKRQTKKPYEMNFFPINLTHSHEQRLLELYSPIILKMKSLHLPMMEIASDNIKKKRSDV